MTGHIGRDPLDLLRHEDPVDLDRLPEASLARLRSASDAEVAGHGRHPEDARPRRLRLATALSAVAAIAVVALVLGLPRDPVTTISAPPTTPATPPAPSTPPTPASPGSTTAPPAGVIIGSCVETYRLETLTHRTFAFAGFVTAVAGDEVIFNVDVPYRGDLADRVTLTATGMTGGAVSPGSGPTLRVGGHYLVAGDERFAWGCGFTQDYDPSVAGAWALALKR